MLEWIGYGAAPVGMLIGWFHARFLRAKMGCTYTQAHRFTRAPLVLFTIVAIVAGVSFIEGMHPDVSWATPAIWDITLEYLRLPPLILCMGYLGTLLATLSFLERHKESWKLGAALSMIMGMILFHHVRSSAPIFDDLHESKTDDGIVLQSSSYSCAPASVANALRCLKRAPWSEAEVARLMGTTVHGTPLGRMEVGISQLGMASSRRKVAQIMQVKAPALLLIDHHDSGPESHVVLFSSIVGDKVEILDPLIGRQLKTPAALEKVWHGRAIEIK